VVFPAPRNPTRRTSGVFMQGRRRSPC
jgi:hypothetical protein